MKAATFDPGKRSDAFHLRIEDVPRPQVAPGVRAVAGTYVLHSLSLAPTIVMVSALIFCLSLIRPKA